MHFAAHFCVPILGMFLLAAFAMALTLWCVFCFRIGLWLVGGGRSQQRQLARMSPGRPWGQQQQQQGGGYQQQQQQQQTNAPIAEDDRKRGRGRCGRRKDRPSSGIGLILVLLLVCLAIFGIKNRTLRRAFASRPAADPALVQATGIEKKTYWTSTKNGKTEQDAEELAREEVYGQVIDYVERELPGPKWLPTQTYLEHRFTKQVGEPLEIRNLGTVQQVTVRVDLKPEDQRDLLRRGRLLLLAKLFGAAVLLLGAIACYIRMDESSKGYYTGWLRLGLVGVFAAVLFGLFQIGVL